MDKEIVFIYCKLAFYKHTRLKGKVPIHAMKACRGSEGISPLILNLRSRRSEWSAWRLFRFIPAKSPKYSLSRLQICCGRWGEEKYLVPPSHSRHRLRCRGYSEGINVLKAKAPAGGVLCSCLGCFAAGGIFGCVHCVGGSVVPRAILDALHKKTNISVPVGSRTLNILSCNAPN